MIPNLFIIIKKLDDAIHASEVDHLHNLYNCYYTNDYNFDSFIFAERRLLVLSPRQVKLEPEILAKLCLVWEFCDNNGGLGELVVCLERNQLWWTTGELPWRRYSDIINQPTLMEVGT